MRNKKALIVVALLLLISVSFTSYAIYKSSADANTEVTAAAWVVSFEDGGTDVTTANYVVEFGVSDCVNNNHVADGVIAPGATCTKTIDVDATGTEVDVVISATAGTPTVGNSAITGANTFTATATVAAANGVIAYNANPQTTTVTVTLAWDDEDDSDAQSNPDTINDADTDLQGATISVPVTLVAKQVLGS